MPLNSRNLSEVRFEGRADPFFSGPGARGAFAAG